MVLRWRAVIIRRSPRRNETLRKTLQLSVHCCDDAPKGRLTNGDTAEDLLDGVLAYSCRAHQLAEAARGDLRSCLRVSDNHLRGRLILHHLELHEAEIITLIPVPIRLLAHEPQSTSGDAGTLQDTACLCRTRRAVRCERLRLYVTRVLTQHGPKRLRNDAVMRGCLFLRETVMRAVVDAIPVNQMGAGPPP